MRQAIYFPTLYSEHLTYTRWAIIEVGDRQLEIFSSRSNKKQRLHVIRIIFCILCVCVFSFFGCLFIFPFFFVVRFVFRSILGFFSTVHFLFLPFILLILLLIFLNNPILFVHWNRPSIRHMSTIHVPIHEVSTPYEPVNPLTETALFWNRSPEKIKARQIVNISASRSHQEP